MALTRARVDRGTNDIAGARGRRSPPAIAGDASTVRADATAMRVRMLRELPPDGPWDVKPRGGRADRVEFIAQVMQLIGYAGAMRPGVESDDADALEPVERGRAGAAGDASAADPGRITRGGLCRDVADHGCGAARGVYCWRRCRLGRCCGRWRRHGWQRCGRSWMCWQRGSGGVSGSVGTV